MNWIKIQKQRPPVNEQVLVLWQTEQGEIVHSVTSRMLIPRHCFDNPAMDDRYFISGTTHEIKPLYWIPLPQKRLDIVDSNAGLKFKPIIHKGIPTHELEEIPAKHDYQEKIWPMPPENNKE